MTISVIAYSQFIPSEELSNPLKYKTDIFEISSGTAISEIYTYFRSNPSIYWMVSNDIPHEWGDSESTPTIGYYQIDNKWEPTSIPKHPLCLKWDVYECDSNGYRPSYLIDLITHLNNMAHYEGQ
jgi:hypothetical protein